LIHAIVFLREEGIPIELHLVGPLQSNKAKDAVSIFDVIQTVDREKIAKALKKEEQDLLTKKTVLSKEEYTKNTDALRKKVIDFQSQRRSAIDKIATQRSNSRATLIQALDPILEAYIKEKNIALILDKKGALGGVPENDITTIITEKLNKTLPSLNLK